MISKNILLLNLFFFIFHYVSKRIKAFGIYIYIGSLLILTPATVHCYKLDLFSGLVKLAPKYLKRTKWLSANLGRLLWMQ
jgi:hypothetical protein